MGQPVGDLGDDRTDRVLARLVGREVVAREHEVEVDQQYQREHGLHGVQHLADVPLVVALRARPAAHDPAGERDERGADGGAGERADGVAEHDEPDDRAADAADRLEGEQPGHRGETLGALEDPVGQADHRDRHEGDRDEQRGDDALQVQQEHQQRRGGERDRGHRAARGQAHRVQLPGVPCGQFAALSEAGDAQRGRGLQPHGRHGADHQHGEQRAELAERRGDQQPCGDDVEQVGRGLRPGDPDGHQECRHPYPVRDLDSQRAPPVTGG